MGAPGSGKTTLAHRLASRVHCPALSRDEFKEGYVHTTGGSHESLGKDVNGRLNEIFFETVDHVISKGISIVIEAAFNHKLWEPKLVPLTEVADVSIIVCSVDRQLARSRHMDRRLEDPTRERFHGDRLVRVTKEGRGLISDYAPPKLNLPTLSVDTTDGYIPGLDQVVAFALQARPDEQDSAVDAPTRAASL